VYEIILALVELRLEASHGRLTPGSVSLGALAEGSRNAHQQFWAKVMARVMATPSARACPPVGLVPVPKFPPPAILSKAAQSILEAPLPQPRAGEAIDHLRPLHEAWIPARERRCLGDHYTPDWLAQRLLDHLDWPGTALCLNAPPSPPTEVRPQSDTSRPLEHRDSSTRPPSSGAPTNGSPAPLGSTLNMPQMHHPRLLDPACGSGVFLLHALARLMVAVPGLAPAEYLPYLAGIDVAPRAARAARINLCLALGPAQIRLTEVPILAANALSLRPPCPPLDQPFSHVVSNPPWVGWEHLPDSQRSQAHALWAAEGLFAQRGWRARMGASKKDLSMLFVALAASRWLPAGGPFGMILPRSLLTSEAARGLRERLAADFSITHVEDLSARKLFPGAAAATVFLTGQVLPPATRAGSHTPIPNRAQKQQQSVGWLEWTSNSLEPRTMVKLPGEALGAPWIAARLEDVEALTRLSGPSHYRAREGVNTGGANGVFWVEILETRGTLCRIRNLPGCGRKPVPAQEAWVEQAMVAPLMRGRDVGPWHSKTSLNILLVQDTQARVGISEAVLRRDAPRTLAFLASFRAFLEARPLYRKYFPGGRAPYYSLYNVGTYTVAPWKVVWREQVSTLTAAVVGPHPSPDQAEDVLLAGDAGKAMRGSVHTVTHSSAVPDHKLMLVACDTREEAHYLCGALNASLVRRFAAQACLRTSMATHLLERIALPAFDPSHAAHRRLSALSEEAHTCTAAGHAPREGLELELDDAVRRLAPHQPVRA